MSLAMVTLTVLTAVLVGATAVLSARTVIYETRQEALLDEHAITTISVFDRISPESSDDEWEYYAESIPGRTMIVDYVSGRRVGELTSEDLPVVLRDVGYRSSGQLTSARDELDGEEVYFISVSRSYYGQNPSSRLGIVTAYPLDVQYRQVAAITQSGALIGGALLTAAVVVSLIMSRSLTKPLRQLRSMAQDMGAGRVPVPMSSFYSDMRDVSEAMRTSSQQLAHALQKLSDKEQQSRRFVSDVAHELRTPLTSMTAIAEVLEDYGVATPEERDAATQVVTRGITRLNSLVSELLELSRLDAKVAPLHVDTRSVMDTLRSAHELVDAPDMIQISCDSRLSVTTDHERLRTIILNLLTNAMRYGRPPIQVNAEHADGVCAIMVSDHGDGIPIEHAEHVFDRFVVLDQSRHRADSTGLGLSIARDNARLLGGDLTLLPSQVGALFYLSFPLRAS